MEPGHVQKANSALQFIAVIEPELLFLVTKQLMVPDLKQPLHVSDSSAKDTGHSGFRLG